MRPQMKSVPMEELALMIEGLIKEGVDVTLTVTGNSMRPLWTTHRDSVVLTGCDPCVLKKGDVPLYRRDDGKYILHRIIKVHETTYDMIGDHQYEVEYGVNKQKVICVVKAFTRNGKQHTCDELGYRFYTWVWCHSVPFRRFMLWLHRLPLRLFKRKKAQD